MATVLALVSPSTALGWYYLAVNTGSYGLNPALRRCLSLDLEISRDGGDLLAAAAYRPDSSKIPFHVQTGPRATSCNC